MTKTGAQDRVLDGTIHVVGLELTPDVDAVLEAVPNFNAVGPGNPVKKLLILE